MPDRMARYLISFDHGAMDHIPDEAGVHGGLTIIDVPSREAALAWAAKIAVACRCAREVQAPELSCAPVANTKVPQTVRGIVRWFVRQERLTTTQPRRVRIGGAKGYSLTVRMAPGAGTRCCGGPKSPPLLYPSNDPGGEFSLGGPSDKAKLHLLNFETLPLAIIADSVDKHGPSLAADSKVISRFHFG